MIWQSVDDMELYKKASALWAEVNGFLLRPGLCRDAKLKEQLFDASDSMVSNLEEGFEQSSDRGFAKYVYTSKGSAAEVGSRLRMAHRRGYISADELTRCLELRNAIGKLATGVVAHLVRTDRKNRGIALRLDEKPTPHTSDKRR